MNEEELKRTIDELGERLEGIQVDLNQTPDASGFSTFQSADGERQMIVHWIDSSEYEANSGQPPESKQEAEDLFLEAVQKNKTQDDRYISHGDLMVADGDPCNYYAYVASVDRKAGGAGYQSEDPGDRAVSEEYPEGAPDWVNREIVIWTETYPGKGMSEEIEYTAVSVTSQSQTDITLPQLTWTTIQYPKVKFDIFKLKQIQESLRREDFGVCRVDADEPVEGHPCEFEVRDIDHSQVSISEGNYNFSEVTIDKEERDSQSEEDKRNFDFECGKLEYTLKESEEFDVKSSFVSIWSGEDSTAASGNLFDLQYEKIGSETNEYLDLVVPTSTTTPGENFSAVGDMSVSIYCNEGDNDYRTFDNITEDKVSFYNQGEDYIDVLGGDLSSVTSSLYSSDYTGSPDNLVTSIDEISQSKGTAVSICSIDFITSITGLDFSSGSKTSDGSMEIVTKGDKSGTDASYALFEIQDDNDCGCLKIKHAGNLGKETYDTEVKTISIFSTPQTFDLEGKTTNIKFEDVPTYLDLTYSNKYAQTKEDVVKVNFEAGIKRISVEDRQFLRDYTREVSEVRAMPVTLNYDLQWYDYPIDETRTVTSWEGKQLHIKLQKGKYTGYEKTFKATKNMIAWKTENRADTAYQYKSELEWKNGKKITVSNELVKFMYKQGNFEYDVDKINFTFANEKKVTLTPTEFKVAIADVKNFGIYSQPTKLVFDEAKRLELLPKDYTFTQMLYNAQFKPSEMSLTTKKTILQADPCTTITATSGGTTNQTVPMLQGSLTPAGQDEFDIHSLRVSTEDTSLYDLVVCDVSLYTTSLGADRDLEWTGVSVHCSLLCDDYYSDCETSYDIFSNDFSANKVSTYETQYIDSTELVKEDKSGFKVTMFEFDYLKGEPEPNSDSIDVITDFTTSISSTVSLNADSLQATLDDYGSYPDLTTSQVSIGSYIYQNTYGECQTSYVSFGSTETEYESVDYPYCSKVSIGSISDTDASFNINLQGYNIKETAPQVSISGDGLSLLRVTFVDDSSEIKLVESGTGPSITSLEVGSATSSTVDELSVEEVSDSDKFGYIPLLDADPVCSDTIYAWDETEGSQSIDCSIGSTGLYITQKVQVQQWDVSCGMIKERADSTTTRSLPSIQLGVEAIYKESITFCEYDSNGNASTRTIDVLTTTEPSSGSADPDGYMLSGECL